MKRAWFHILLAIAEGPSHGADVQRRVSEQTGGAVTLYPVTLYRSLDELTTSGFIEECPEPAAAQHNERRRYYAITTDGRRALRAEADALQAAARLAHAALKTGGGS